MNLANLKEGMLIRDMDKLLEVVQVDIDSAVAQVLLEGKKRPQRSTRVTYSADGVWSFVASPTDDQLALLEAFHQEDKRDLGFAGMRIALAGGDTWPALDDEWAQAVAAVQKIPSIMQVDDGELKTGDRVSWLRDSRYRVQGTYWKQVRNYHVCVAIGNQQRVALKREAIAREHG